MRKQITATLVSAVILFVWQFLSWAALQVHYSEFQYTSNQDQIMEVLNKNLTKEGIYMLPGVPPGTSAEQERSTMEANHGKPWANITYRKSMDANMTFNMIRGFAADLLAAFLLVWLLMKFENLTIPIALQASIGVGAIGFLTIPYLHSIWFDGDSTGHLLDAVVQWGIVGLWLGWWLPERFQGLVGHPAQHDAL